MPNKRSQTSFVVQDYKYQAIIVGCARAGFGFEIFLTNSRAGFGVSSRNLHLPAPPIVLTSAATN